jgi:ABC-type enterochelin transport system ATPase subunit
MIVAVKDGAVAEIGTHDELMEMGGVYKQLVELQVKMLYINSMYTIGVIVQSLFGLKDSYCFS